MIQPLPISIHTDALYRPAMKVQTVEEALVYFARLVERQVARGESLDNAFHMERVNILWYAGSFVDRDRIIALYTPIFQAQE